jgi:hypothetical protein
MKRPLLTLPSVVLLALSATLVSAFGAADRSGLTPLPHWLKRAEVQTLDRVFGGATPIHTYYVSYSRKIAVVFEFKHVVRCLPCSSPSATTQPRGRLIRISYDRQTHKIRSEDGLRFCEWGGSSPPRAGCLRR